MNVNELRIGNCITDVRGEAVDLTEALFVDLIQMEWIHIVEPIELTEEWLIKFGFKKDKTDDTYYKNDFEICLPNYFMYKGALLNKVKYVHSFQNLYFSLESNELELK